ncbi:MAG: MFS transporter [Novosphingobium sp.]
MAKAQEIQDSERPAIPKAAWFALFVLTAANVLNYLDRQIVSILGQSIKEDLALDDAQLGFLLGTAFAIFYSVVGIAMGGIADRLTRKKVMAFGLTLWSAMTALGGVATGFVSLSLARIGVGIGEAAAVPCAQSLVAETFPPRHRTLAMGTYVSAAFLGGAIAMIAGGWFLQNWPTACAAVPVAGACGLAPWKAALFAVAAPGIPVALLLLLVREPYRAPPADGVTGIAPVVSRQFAVALPPFSNVTVWRIGGAPALRRNMTMVAGIAMATAMLVWLTGDLAQWVSLGFGAVAVVTWGQIQSLADKPLFRLTLGDPSFLLVTLSTALSSCIFSSMSAWSAPLAMRHFPGIPKGELGLGLGLAHPMASFIGIYVGSWITDRWKARDPRASFLMGAVSMAGALPFVVLAILARDYSLFLMAYFGIGFMVSLWSGATATMIQDLSLPRMRGQAAACYSMIVLVLSFGLGAYWAGKVSTVTGSLEIGILSMLLLAPVVIAMQLAGARRLPGETFAARRALAEAAGEPA